MKVQYEIYLCFILHSICTIINVECIEKFAAYKNDTVNNRLMVYVREIKQGKKTTGFTGKPNVQLTNKPIGVSGKVKPNYPPKPNNFSKQNDSKRKSPSNKNAAVIPANAFPQTDPSETLIIVGNQNNNMSEIYKLRFTCTDNGCEPDPVKITDRIWFSPYTKAISEVKAVMYLDKLAVLVSMNDGVIIYENDSKTVLFKKEFDPSVNCMIHSAEVLPDGNVIAACSMEDGRFGILYHDGHNHIQKGSDTHWVKSTPFAHAVVYQNSTGHVYAGAYLTIIIMKYTHKTLKVLKKIDISQFYDETNKQDNGTFEDGIHDMYPVEGDLDHLYVTTGEHAFLFHVKDEILTKHHTLYTIPSWKGRQLNVEVKAKGGIKAISSDAKLGVLIAKSAPWFKEHYKNNYPEKGAVVIWSMPNRAKNNGFCHEPDYDITDRCKIKFHDQLNSFYKVRVFQINVFSYGP